MKNVNFTYGDTQYTIKLTTKQDSFQYCNKFAVEISATDNMVRVRRQLEDDENMFNTDTLVHEEKLALNKVRASNFLDWYIRDVEAFTMLGYKVYDLLRASGKATLSVVDIFNECPIIPSEICENLDNDMINYRTEDVIFIDDLTPVELTDEQKMYYYEKF